MKNAVTAESPRDFLKNHPNLFLMNPKNKAYLEGEIKTPVQISSDMPFGLIAFTGTFVIIGFMIIGMAVTQWVDYIILKNNGVVAEATYIDSDISEDSEGDDNYYVTYRYVYKDMEYEHEQEVDRGIYNNYEYGASVSILLDPDYPERSQIEQTISQPTETSFMAVFWNGLVWLITGILLSAYRNQKKLANEGYLIKGEILNVDSLEDRDDDLKLTIDYAFTSPESGLSIENSETATRNDLAMTILPKVGDSLAILYANDKTTSLL